MNNYQQHIQRLRERKTRFYEMVCESSTIKILECKLDGSEYCPRTCSLYQSRNGGVSKNNSPSDTLDLEHDGTLEGGVFYGGRD